MEENAAPFTKQSIESILSKIASNRKYSPTLPTEPPRQADKEAFQDLMNNSPENIEGPGPQPFQDLLNQQPPVEEQEQEQEEDV